MTEHEGVVQPAELHGRTCEWGPCPEPAMLWRQVEKPNKAKPAGVRIALCPRHSALVDDNELQAKARSHAT